MRDRDPVAAERRFAAALVCAAAAAAMLLVAAPADAADLYRWVDENGEVHFSDRRPDVEPPGGVEGPPPVTVEELRARDRAEAERRAEEARREREAREAREQRTEQMAREMNEPKVESPYDCAEARKFLAYYSEGDADLYRKDESGAYRPMTADEVAATIAQWKRAVEMLCKDESAASDQANAAAESSPPAESNASAQ